MDLETHNKLNKISTFMVVFSILVILVSFFMLFKSIDAKNEIHVPIFVLLFGLVCFVGSIILIITNNLTWIYLNYKKELYLLTIIEVISIIATIIFRFSWYTLLSVMLVNFVLVVSMFAYARKVSFPKAITKKSYQFTWKTLVISVCSIVILIYFNLSSSIKFYGLLFVQIVSMIIILIFWKKSNEFSKRIEKMSKDKRETIRTSMIYSTYIFLSLIPSSIDITFNILYVPNIIHLLVVGLYVLGYFVYVCFSKNNSNKWIIVQE